MTISAQLTAFPAAPPEPENITCHAQPHHRPEPENTTAPAGCRFCCHLGSASPGCQEIAGASGKVLEFHRASFLRVLHSACRHVGISPPIAGMCQMDAGRCAPGRLPTLALHNMALPASSSQTSQKRDRTPSLLASQYTTVRHKPPFFLDRAITLPAPRSP